MRLENKVAFISGGARGMGAVEAKMFSQEGAKVVFGDVLDEEGQRVEAEIREGGGDATYVHARDAGVRAHGRRSGQRSS